MTTPTILDARGRPIRATEMASKANKLRAKYDAAQTNDENSRHWSYADSLSADSAANPAIRQVLRNRSRYEVANNSYARGIVNFIANDTIGGNIRLTMNAESQIGSNRSAFARKRLMTRDEASFVEGEFFDWLQEIMGVDKLRTMRGARAVDGEGFSLLGTNKRLESPVKLDVMPFEAELCQDSVASLPDRTRVDGIKYDAWGNPTSYRVLHEHPGSMWGVSWGDATWHSSENVLHLFVPERPGQRRGVPQLTPSLPLFAQLRRFTLAVIAAAETAADFAAILFTTNANEEAASGTPFDLVEIERRMMQVMPEGWDMRQFKAEQPVSTYAEFVRTILREINRCLETPMNVAIGDSSGYNYASGKLDWQIWEKARSVDRNRIVSQVLNPLFTKWKHEAILIEGYLPQSLRNNNVDWSHDWLFDGDRHQDPLKEASAQEKRLRNHTSTLADEWGRSGADWEEKLSQIARERAVKVKLGIPLDDPIVPDDEDDDEDDKDDEIVMSRDEHGRLTGMRGKF